MYITTQKEEFSYAYINAIASAAGYFASLRSPNNKFSTEHDIKGDRN
ncbi:MAG: hypothetical protein RMX97_26250 [Nostoc sp. DedQUE11]|nr:hypothetical protein [Nostoc sp. DedQUE11]